MKMPQIDINPLEEWLIKMAVAGAGAITVAVAALYVIVAHYTT